MLRKNNQKKNEVGISRDPSVLVNVVCCFAQMKSAFAGFMVHPLKSAVLKSAYGDLIESGLRFSRERLAQPPHLYNDNFDGTT